MDSLAHRYTEDHSVNQDTHKVGHIVEETVEDSLKLLIEGIYFMIQQRQDRLTVSFESMDDTITNIKDAMRLGASDRDIRNLINVHSATQSIAKNYPENLTQYQDRIIDRANKDLLVEQQQSNPSYKQELEQAQKQEQKQSQGQSLGF